MNKKILITLRILALLFIIVTCVFKSPIFLFSALFLSGIAMSVPRRIIEKFEWNHSFNVKTINIIVDLLYLLLIIFTLYMIRNSVELEKMFFSFALATVAQKLVNLFLLEREETEKNDNVKKS